MQLKLLPWQRCTDYYFEDTVEAPVSGRLGKQKKCMSSATEAGRLRECVNTEFVWALTRVSAQRASTVIILHTARNDYHSEYDNFYRHSSFVIISNNALFFFRLFMEAKMCNGELMAKYCKFDKMPPRDPFNPFCPDKRDPKPPKAGTGKAYTSVALTFMALAIYLLL